MTIRFVRGHQHTATERADRRVWAKPLRNPAGLDPAVMVEIAESVVRGAVIEHEEGKPDA
jgi:hypothetical protein